jgi:ribose 5-phosphate isomerase B
LFCKTGAGTAMVANKHHGIRAVECASLVDVRQARECLDINVMAVGASNVSIAGAKLMARFFLDSKPLGGKHMRRRQKIEPSSRVHPL